MHVTTQREEKWGKREPGENQDPEEKDSGEDVMGGAQGMPEA